MDDYTKKMMASAQARQKKLDTKFTSLGLQQKIPLHESQPNIPTENSRNFDEISKIKRKAVHSDSVLTQQSYSVKENIERLNTACSKTNMTHFSSELPGNNSPKSTHKTLNFQKENFEMEIKFNSPDDVRVEVEIVDDASDSENDDKDSKSSTQSLSSRKDVKSRLKQLGKLYTEDAELSSPIHRTEEKFHEELSSDDKNDEIPACKKLQNEARRKRLAALASNRDNWEDDLSHPKNALRESTCVKSPKKSWKPPAPKPPTQESTTKTKITPKKKSPAPQPPVAPPPPPTTPLKADSKSESPTKQLKWDKNVLDTLESQGFSRTDTTTQKLVFDYSRPTTENDKETSDTDEQKDLDESIENNTSPVKKITAKLNVNLQSEHSESSKISKIAQKFDNEPKKESKPETKSIKPMAKSPSKSILSKTALFESNSPSKTKDPALLSVSERKALFEKNKGEALIPKAAFAMPIPKPTTETPTKPTKEVIETKVVKEVLKPAAKVEKKKPEIKTKPESTVKPSSVSESSGGIAGKLKALLHQATTISESQIRNARESEKKRELDMLKNRFTKSKEVIDEESQNTSEHEEEDEQSSSDEDNTEISETTKMIKAQKNKIVTFQRSRESLASLASKTSKTSKKSVESTKLLSIDSSDSSKSTSSASKRRSSGDSPVVQAVLEDVKRIKISPPKNGHLYPCLSDIEASTANEDTEVDDEQTEEHSDENNSSIIDDEDELSDEESSDIADTSLGREILEAVSRNHNNSKNKRQILDESTTTSDISDVLNDMNEYLDGQSTDTDAGPTPPKNLRSSPSKNGTATSHSFNYKRSSTSSSNTSSSLLSSPIKQASPTKLDKNIPTHILDGDSTVPLIHTVSFYRRQQSQEQRTPVKKIVRQAAVESESDNELQTVSEKESDQKLVNEKIQHLMDEVCKQQTVISQTSQAINLCTSTIEFSGSSEEVEAERLLLLATQRRQAALHESQRLRIERTLHPTSTNNTNLFNVNHCCITISDIVLPLKRDYIRALTAAGGLGHHFLCVIRYTEHVFATPLIATGNPPNPPQICVRIPGTLKLEQVHPEFTITVEVYSMQAHEEVLPHEIKYHIAGKDKKTGKLLTPKKSKHSTHDSKLVKPSVQSPAGPNAVRTSSFQLMGYIIFSIKEVNRTQWSLNKVPYISPLEGNIQMRVQCDISVNIEMRGFLTMFEDVSGFGAWHRRWCYLKGESLSYWKYPDDERKKAPINSINLQGCITENVNLVSRDICARPNTFLLEFVRPRQSGDTESLVMVVKKDQTLIRHLLSADTKEERIEWCQQLNKSLISIKSFNGCK